MIRGDVQNNANIIQTTHTHTHTHTQKTLRGRYIVCIGVSTVQASTF